MVQRVISAGMILVAGMLGGAVWPAMAQQPAAGTKVVQITGLVGVKPNAKGSLTPDNGKLQFESAKGKASVPIPAVEDVTTGNDSERMFRGTLGTLTMLAPYGGGRFLSLFRSKMDTLTIQYRDAEGGLHGAIFTMPVGTADALKKELVAQGAHTSIPVQDDTGNTEAKPNTKGKQP